LLVVFLSRQPVYTLLALAASKSGGSFMHE
jgi:hypothetical protein